jgi:hypothetical protein
MAPAVRRSKAWWDDYNRSVAYLHGTGRSRKGPAAMYPYLNSNSPNVRTAMNARPQGSAASRMYPNLPNESRSRVRRRRYGSLE